MLGKELSHEGPRVQTLICAECDREYEPVVWNQLDARLCPDGVILSCPSCKRDLAIVPGVPR